MAKQHPRLVRSDLTGTVYVLTRYKTHPDGLVEALEKWDVTDQFNELVQEREADRPERFVSEATMCVATDQEHVSRHVKIFMVGETE